MAAKHYQLISEFKGYRNKRDKTNLEPGVLVSGSQNVISTDGERIAARKGYTIFGAPNTDLTPIRSSYEWSTHRGVEIPVRRYADQLEFAYNNTWYPLMSGLSTTAITQFAEVWQDSEKQDLLLFVDGDSNLYDWSGGFAVLASATVNTLTLDPVTTGVATWGESGFLTLGTRSLIINGVTATYTGGEGTDTLTGVTVDFSATAAGAVVVQAVRTNSNKPGSNLKNNLIDVLNNQVYVGQTDSRLVYVSKATDFTDFTYASPRIPGDGALITLDGAVVGFVVQEDAMYISAGKDYWYQIIFTLSADTTNEALTVKRLNTGSQQAAQSQSLIGKAKNSIILVSNEPTLDLLGRVENINTPQSLPISDPIKSDFDKYDFTNGHIKYHKNNIYVALPAESILLIFNVAKGYWEAPQVLPVRRLAIIGGELYAHSNVVPETYRLFDGTNDNGNSIAAIAAFSYQNYGDRGVKKNHTEWFTEGYISANSELTLTLRYDYEGFTSEKDYVIEGDDETILFQTSIDDSLGTNPLGDESLGGGGGEEEELPPKFRHIQGTTKEDFFEIQTLYSSDAIDQSWELLAFGGDITQSTTNNSELVK